LTPLDRTLLQRCLNHEPAAWQDFVDRFVGMIYSIVHHTAHQFGTLLSPEDTEDVAAEILLQIVANDYAVLQQFRGQSTLATYLTVIARRICIHELNRRNSRVVAVRGVDRQPVRAEAEATPRAEVALESVEQVQQMLGKLPAKERRVVRLYYLEGRSYEEISAELNIPVNSIGPILSRARKKLRQDA
jgi:RNA polymerase sigma-70 factor (ECF subfamily)